MPSPDRIPTTARHSRRHLPLPLPASEERGTGGELAAIDALFDAYMALNATNTRLAYDDHKFSPMRTTGRAAIEALARIEGVGHAGAERIWEHMVGNASGAQWNYDLWRKGEI
jgi:hypothetical protein